MASFMPELFLHRDGKIASKLVSAFAVCLTAVGRKAHVWDPMLSFEPESTRLIAMQGSSSGVNI
jgi:hypothetical protein